jgi:hypothetical protein
VSAYLKHGTEAARADAVDDVEVVCTGALVSVVVGLVIGHVE